MKIFFIGLVLIFTINSAFAQTDIPAYGKIDKKDLEMKTCDFDKDAEALVLFDVGEFTASINSGTIQNIRRIRIKILKDKGLERANVHIKYYSVRGYETVTDIAAQTYNLDAAGNIIISKLEKKLIYTKELNKRHSEVSFTLPEVKAGSVIEYKYVIDGSENGSWYFQKSIPVKLSRFTVDFPHQFEMNAIQNTTLPIKKETLSRSLNSLQVYTMENVPALRDEPFIYCDEDYLQRVQAILVAVNPDYAPRKSLLRTWPEVIKSLMEDDDFGVQLKRNIPRTADLDAMLKDITDPYKKMVTIHEYVRNNMEWNGYDNIWALNGVKSAWKDKKGTSGEINLIMVNLLKEAGLNVHPILVSTRDNGKVNTVFATISAFDKVMAYVEINGRKYVLDATEKITPSKLIPLDVLNSEGLVIEKIDTGEWGWQMLSQDDEIFNNTVLLMADIDKDGLMTGEASINSTGYARIGRMSRLKEGKKQFTDTYINTESVGANVDSVYFENEKNDNLPLVQHVAFKQSLSSSGDYKYFTANMFSGLEKNPFYADNRFSDIFFGYKQHIVIIGNFKIPEGYQFEELPKNVKMIMPDTGIVFTRIAQVEEDRLSLKITLDFNRPSYYIEEYPEFKEFYKKLFELLNEQFVYRKKS
jgi:hypothetical protein